VIVNARPGQVVTVSVLTPVEECHERQALNSPNSTSIEASPSSPVNSAIGCHSLTSIVAAPLKSTRNDPVHEDDALARAPAALNSHPTSKARSRSSSRNATHRQPSSDQAYTQQGIDKSSSTGNHSSEAPSRGDGSVPGPDVAGHRRSSTRRSPSASSTVRSTHSYRRSCDLTASRRVPASIAVASPRQTIYSAYFNRRSRSMEPTPSPRIFLDSARSPTSTISSGSTDVEPASDDDDPMFSPKDPERYFEARQLWNGLAGEGRKGFYANVVDDYRMIGKDVNAASDEFASRSKFMKPPLTPGPEVTLKKTGVDTREDRVKIAGVDPAVVAEGPGHTLVPSCEELWG
jgi:hypothetical protein